MNADPFIALIGGRDDQNSKVREVEVVRISDEGVVSPSTCQLPELQVEYAAASNNLICGGGYYPDTTNECQELNSEAMKWKEASPMKKKRYGHAMTNANNQRYVCGGLDESYSRLRTCEKLDKEWSFIKDIPRPLSGHCMIGTGDSIYLIGGYYGSEVSE